MDFESNYKRIMDPEVIDLKAISSSELMQFNAGKPLVPGLEFEIQSSDLSTKSALYK